MIAAVVGTVLNVIAGIEMPGAVRIALLFIVPFIVANLGAVMASRANQG